METTSPVGVKTNFDGAMFHDTGEVDLGVVIRNHDGEVMVALSEKNTTALFGHPFGNISS